MDGIARGLRDSPMWQLLDEQLVAYNVVRGLVERAAAEEGKAVVIIRGGPGTGKSVIAAHLLVAMSRRGFTAVHATGSKAFTRNKNVSGVITFGRSHAAPADRFIS